MESYTQLPIGAYIFLEASQGSWVEKSNDRRKVQQSRGAHRNIRPFKYSSVCYLLLCTNHLIEIITIESGLRVFKQITSYKEDTCIYPCIYHAPPHQHMPDAYEDSRAQQRLTNAISLVRINSLISIEKLLSY